MAFLSIEIHTALLQRPCWSVSESLDTLESWVKEIFALVPNNQQPPPSFNEVTDSFDTAVFNKLYQVVPVKNIHQVELTWQLPCMKNLYR